MKLAIIEHFRRVEGGVMLEAITGPIDAEVARERVRLGGSSPVKARRCVEIEDGKLTFTCATMGRDFDAAYPKTFSQQAQHWLASRTPKEG